MRKAKAVGQRYGAISVAATRELWRGDTTPIGNRDAWAAFDEITEPTLRSNIERHGPEPGQAVTVISAEKAKIGDEPAIFIDYIAAQPDAGISIRIRSYWLLRDRIWWSVSCATKASEPDAYLPELAAAARSFRFR